MSDDEIGAGQEDETRDTVYTNSNERYIYRRESNSTGWFVGIIVALALLAIAYLIFSANSQPSTAVNPFKAAVGGTVVSYDKSGIVLKQTDGACGMLTYVGWGGIDYGKTDCPAPTAPTTPTAPSSTPASASAPAASTPPSESSASSAPKS